MDTAAYSFDEKTNKKVYEMAPKLHKSYDE